MTTQRSHKGQSLVEFALLLPILLIILVIVADLSRAIAARVCLSNAAREGARYGANHPLDWGGIRNRVLLEYNDTGMRVTGMSLRAEDVLISFPSGAAAPGNYIRVATRTNFPLWFGTFFPTGFVQEDGTLLIEGAAEMVIF